MSYCPKCKKTGGCTHTDREFPYSTPAEMARLERALKAERDAVSAAAMENQRLRERVEVLEAKLKEAEAEVPYLKHLHVEGGAVDVTIEGAKRVVGLLATSLAKMFADAGATNYVQYEVRNGEHDYILLLQAREKKTPHQLRQEAEASRDLYAEQLKEAIRLREVADKDAERCAAERDAALDLVKTVTEELTANGAEWEKEASKRLAQVAGAQREADARALEGPHRREDGNCEDRARVRGTATGSDVFGSACGNCSRAELVRQTPLVTEVTGGKT